MSIKNTILCILFLSLLFIDCVKLNKKGVPITLSFWGSTEEIEIIKKTIEPWDEKRDDLYVILQHVPIGGGQTANYVQKVLTEMASGTAPDVIFMEVNIFVNFCFKDMLLDMKPFMEKDKDFHINDFYPGVVDRFTYKDQILVVPRDTAPFNCVYYNKNLFNKYNIPYPKDDWTWDDLVKIAVQLTERDSNDLTTQYGFYTWTFMGFVYSAGGGFVNDVDNPTLCIMNTPQSREGLKFYYDLMYTYRVSPRPSAVGEQNGLEMFETGRLAMYGSGIWETPRLRKVRNFEWDIVPFPKHPKKGLKTGTGGSGYSILKSTKYPDKAWEVVKCLAGDYGQSILGDTGLAQPAKIKIAASKHFARDGKAPANKAILLDSVANVVYEPFVSEWNEIYSKYVGREIDLYHQQKQTLDQTVKNIEAKVNEALKGRRTKIN